MKTYFSIYCDSQVFTGNAVITDLISVFDSIPFLLTVMGLTTSVYFHKVPALCAVPISLPQSALMI